MKIPNHDVDDRHPALICVRLGRLRQTAQRHQGLASRLLRRHAAPQVVVDVQLEVRRQLFVELASTAGAADHAGQSTQPPAEGSHDRSPGARNRPRIAEVRCHSRVSRSTRFLPDLVRR